MTDKTFSLLEQYMLICAADSAHDREHIYRVLYNAMEIVASLTQVDTDVLIAACLLHDIARPVQAKDPSICHARHGAKMAETFLLESGFSTDFAQKTADCIRTHRFRASDPPQSIEAKILFDADKLDVTGAIGIARTLLYQGVFERPLYLRKETGEISDGTQDSSPSFFQEYHFKLANLYDRFYTQKGKELALQNQEAAISFYESLLRQVRAGGEGKARLDILLGKNASF